MENVSDLKVGAVVENQVAANYYVHVIGGRGRKHDFQLSRAGLHSALKTGRQSSANDQLALQAGRQAITLGQAGGKMGIVLVIPAANFAIVLDIALVVVAATMTVIAIAIPTAVMIRVVITIVPSIIVIAIAIVTVALSCCKGR